ncbi:MAG: cyclic nucleotide-binding domain-containing protein [Myxococcota bacterium]
MRLASWAATDQGRRRKNNEDYYLVAPELSLVAVADGMGGFERGDVASQLACNVLKETLSAHTDVIEAYRRNQGEAQLNAVMALLQNAVQRACSEVHDAASALAAGGRMGTTLDVVLVIGATAFLAHVGDGRVYLVREGEAHQLTEDHTLVNEQLKEGVITQEEARRARNRSVITRALGAFPSVLVDTLHFALDPDDVLILCSDGLHRYVGSRELGFTVGEELSDRAASELIDLANQRGGRDNITVVICGMRDPDEERSLLNSARMDALRKADLLSTCTYRELMEICEGAEQRKFSAGKILFTEGEVGRECFFIEKGEIRIEKDGVLLTTLGAGASFGEMSFLDFPHRSATARAGSDASVLVLHRDRFLQLMRQDADLGAKISWQLLKKLSRIIRTTNEQLVAESVPLEDELDTDPG